MNQTNESGQLLRLEGIGKVFPGVVALENVNFTLNAGEVHAICGENGAGKSTLMKVVTGVHQSDSGRIFVNGRECTFRNPLEAYQTGIAIIYQETSLFEEMTVLENLFIGREITKRVLGIEMLDYRAMERRAEKIFKTLEVNIPLDTKVKQCGIAQKQMIEIAKALTFDSKILILDEPTASLTNREIDGLFSIITRLKESGVGIVYISHRLEEIFTLCDRVTVLRDGKYISTKQVRDTNKDELVADMVGRSMDNYYPKVTVEIGEPFFQVEHFSNTNIVRDVSFELRKGEILGFAGLAGSGRTELAMSLCKLDPVSFGTVKMDGRKLKMADYRDAMANGIVYVSEDRGKYGVLLDMSIRDNITLPQIDRYTTLGLIKKLETFGVSDKMRTEMGIKAPDVDFLVANLSGGNQQKVSVSKALALSPRILILDEPTRGVDVGAKAEIHKMISALIEKGLSIIMISSELPELLGMCDRIYVMRDGKIAGCLNRDEATQEKILNIALMDSDEPVAGNEVAVKS